MIKDERISGTKSRIASRAFGMWYFLLLATLLYRQFFLKQPLEEYWDIALIFFSGTFYVIIASYARGAVYEHNISRYWKWTVPTIVITIVVLNVFQAKIGSVLDLVEVVVSALVGVSTMGFVLYILYRRWEQQKDISR